MTFAVYIKVICYDVVLDFIAKEICMGTYLRRSRCCAWRPVINLKPSFNFQWLPISNATCFVLSKLINKSHLIPKYLNVIKSMIILTKLGVCFIIIIPDNLFVRPLTFNRYFLMVILLINDSLTRCRFSSKIKENKCYFVTARDLVNLFERLISADDNHDVRWHHGIVHRELHACWVQIETLIDVDSVPLTPCVDANFDGRPTVRDQASSCVSRG